MRVEKIYFAGIYFLESAAFKYFVGINFREFFFFFFEKMIDVLLCAK